MNTRTRAMNTTRSSDQNEVLYSAKDLEDPILAYCLKNCDDSMMDWAANIKFPVETKKHMWSLPDLFIRQWLNNMQDGFGLQNVGAVYAYLADARDELIEKNLISKNGVNNSGNPLWKDYDFVYKDALRYAKHAQKNPVKELFDPNLSQLENKVANFLLAGAHSRDFFGKS